MHIAYTYIMYVLYKIVKPFQFMSYLDQINYVK